MVRNELFMNPVLITQTQCSQVYTQLYIAALFIGGTNMFDFHGDMFVNVVKLLGLMQNLLSTFI